MILHNAKFYIKKKQVTFTQFMKAVKFNEMLEVENG